MSVYSVIAIIYNPAGTGDGKRNALALRRGLLAAGYDGDVELITTKHAGHAENLAYRLAKKSPHPLIISSSGDGGYNEVINGALRAQQEGAHPACGILPSGNANDHYHSIHTKPLIGQIMSGEQLRIDILQIDSVLDGSPWRRYAHSYIGVGLTPEVGQQLNQARLNRFREAWIVARTLYRFRPTELIVKDKRRSYDSLIFSNIGRMSKVLQLSNTSELSDGRFEVIPIRAHGRFYLLRRLLKAATLGLGSRRKYSSFSFTTVSATRIQLDGEIRSLDAHAASKISIQDKLLRCVI